MAAPAPRCMHDRDNLSRPLGGGARGKLQGWLSRSLAQKTLAADRGTEPPSSKNKMADRRVLEIMPIWRGTGSSNPFRSSGESTNFRFLSRRRRSLDRMISLPSKQPEPEFRPRDFEVRSGQIKRIPASGTKGSNPACSSGESSTNRPVATGGRRPIL